MWNMCGLCVEYESYRVYRKDVWSREESVEYKLRVETVDIEVGYSDLFIFDI